ncbi:MAG: hypothetical protein ACRCW0_04740 [Clostridium sp.]
MKERCYSDGEDILSSNYNKIDKNLKKTSKIFLGLLLLVALIILFLSGSLIFDSTIKSEEAIFSIIMLITMALGFVAGIGIPFMGIIFGIIYFKNTKRKIYMLPIIICSLWLTFLISNFI